VEVYRDISDFKTLKNAVVTTGTFDGVHLGHRAIIDNVIKIAKETGGESVLVTFHPHPRIVLQPNCNLQLLTSIEERIELLAETGLDHLIVIPFDKEFSRLSSLEFVRDLLVNKVGTKKLIIGYDHHFGRNREGSFAHLKEFGPVYGFEVKEIPAQDVDSLKVSSTKVRYALEEGDAQLAAKLLGHPYSLSGEVVEGKKLGREIGFPTANIKVNESRKLIPKYGVYAVKIKYVVDHETKYFYGMLNIGVKPTFDLKEFSIEVHIFDFDEDLYGMVLEIFLLDRIREEVKFDDVIQLKKQLIIDKEQCLKLIQQHSY
jgi:riboflavin kinase/FMN adenylyltransferase